MTRPSGCALPLVAAALIWLCLSSGVASAQTPAGSVVGLGGGATLERNGQRYPLQMGEPVYPGDAVLTPPNSKVKLRMSDGSILSVAPATSVRIDVYTVDGSGQRQSAVVSLGQGLLRAVTAPVGRPAAFEVDTAVGISGARSTDWFVEAGAGYQQVAVLGGSVLLRGRAGGRGVVVPAGSGSRIDAGGQPTPPRVVSQDEFAALLAQTEGAAAPAAPPPALPPPGPPPGGGYYGPPGGIQIPLPIPGDGGRRGTGEPGGSRGGTQPPSHSR
jgi:hypothetical protein